MQPVIERIDYSEWNLWKVPKIVTENNSINIKREDGVRFLDFASAFNECGELFEKLFKRSSFTQLDGAFNAFTLAFLTRGIFIYVPDNLKSTEPIDLDFLQANKSNPIVHQRVLIYIGNHSSVEISEKYFSDGNNERSVHVHVNLIAEAEVVNYRGQVYVAENGKHSDSHIECDTIILDGKSKSDTIPYNEIHNSQVNFEHEAKVSKVSEEQLYYLMSRGLTEQQATEMIIVGFVEPISKDLPMEYAVELNRLIAYEMEDSVG